VSDRNTLTYQPTTYMPTVVPQSRHVAIPYRGGSASLEQSLNRSPSTNSIHTQQFSEMWFLYGFICNKLQPIVKVHCLNYNKTLGLKATEGDKRR
jgi:hypothetical protein